MKKLKKHTKETIIIGIILIGLSLFLHFLHYKIFNDLHHTLIFLFADIAFIPMDVFFTAFVIERLLDKREKAHKLEKLIIIKGVFFSEFGTELLEEFIKADDNVKIIGDEAHISKEWGKEEFKNLEKITKEYSFEINPDKLNIEKISKILNDNKEYIVSTITNPTLMEHESFSELAISLFHLRDELQDRYFKMEYECGCCDRGHIAKDVQVSYRYIVNGWVMYMNHLKEEYPQLFVKAMIQNPFEQKSFEEKYEVYKLKKENYDK
ncbi:hypothetical protein [uncultured Clostridium sp.]|uniref:hypothetical protein n=1 Tax=uncultured Clostridium sp. TaxID=59620 RepID=UPI0026036E5D|nr:hypothetical protein [uncultured Clostridium sp.]